MALDQFLGALSGGESNNSNQGTGGQDALSGLLGGLLGGQSGGQQDGMTQLLGGLLGGQGGGQQDCMTQLLGGLLSGQTQNQATGQNGQLGDALGMLEGLMGSGGAGQALGITNQGSNLTAGDPVMQLLTPLVDELAAKTNIPPQIAVVVVSFVAHQLLSSHPASGRQSLVDVPQLQQQLSSGQGVSHDYLHASGLVGQLVQQTGLDKNTAAKSLKTVFDMLGQS